jgi:hypothetical protein
MNDVIDELQASYTAHTSELCATDACDALILGATVRGNGMRRARRRRRSGALALIVAVVVAAASVAIAQRPDHRLRVVTTESTGATTTTVPASALPIATNREFPDLARLLKLVESEVANDAQVVDDVRAEVVLTTTSAFPLTGQSNEAAANNPLYAVQLTGTTFVCHSCSITRFEPHGPALLIGWDPANHFASSFAVGGKPTDLSTLGPVYQIVLRDSRPASAQEVCSLADLEGPGLAMPAPDRITSPVVLEVLPNYSRLDPAPGVEPKVSAAAAWRALTRNLPFPATSAQLLLGYYSTPLGGGVNHVLAWVVRAQHLAYAGVGGPAPIQRDGTLLPGFQPPVCEFTNAVLTLDATKGTGLVEGYGG